MLMYATMPFRLSMHMAIDLSKLMRIYLLVLMTVELLCSLMVVINLIIFLTLLN